MSENELQKIKEKYPLCASVAFYNAKLFNVRKFRVFEDKEFLKDAFNRADLKILEFMETFYFGLNREYAGTLDILNKSPRVALEKVSTDDALSFADLYDDHKLKISKIRSVAAKKNKKVKK